MSPINSRAKGKRGELEFIQRHLIDAWPEAKRNLDQFGADKRDVIEVAGISWQIKRVEALNFWKGFAQAKTEAAEHDIPILAARRNLSPWLCTLEANELIPMLRLRDAVLNGRHDEDCDGMFLEPEGCWGRIVGREQP